MATGDVNGDGRLDVIVGSERCDAGHAGEGAAFVYLGTAVLDSDDFIVIYREDSLGESSFPISPAIDLPGFG